MPRGPDGTYNPALPPVAAGQTIESNWGNQTVNDFGTEITDSLSRSGKGGMLAPFKVADGSVTTPGLAFTNETGSGLYRQGAGDVRMAVLGADLARWNNGAMFQWNATETRWEAFVTQENVYAKRLASEGQLRHKSVPHATGDITIDPDVANRHTVTNDGAFNVTVTPPTGADGNLGENYEIEGTLLVTNGASPGLITIVGAAAGDIIGVQPTTPNTKYILTYIAHRSAGDGYNVLYVWSAG